MSSLALPLEGVRVIDLSRVLSGPYCSLMLADMGADVIKIEHPKGGDDSRNFSIPNVDGHSVYFMTVNRNKRSVALDLKSQDGRRVFLKLVEKADIVLENFRTGVMERLGLGYDTLKAVKPELVYCAISGYGRDGPNANVPGYDPVAQAETGLMSMSGARDGEPVRTGSSLVDMVCGMFAAQAVTAALLHAQRSGEGRFVEANLHETGLNMLINFAGAHLVTGAEPTRAGNTNQVAQPAGVYVASDGPFMLAVANDAQFARMCRDVLHRPELAEDARFRSNPQRVENAKALSGILAELFLTSTRDNWVSSLRQADVPSGVIATVAEAFSSDLVAARGSVRELAHSGVGSYRALMSPVQLGDTKANSPIGAPLLGEHTVEVLRDLAGLPEEDISRMVVAGTAKVPG